MIELESFPTTMHLYLLGKTELVDDDGQLVSLPTKKILLLLAILATNAEKALSRSLLCELIWPNALPEAARSSLRNALAAIRKVLGETSIQSNGDRIGLSPTTLVCDAANKVSFDNYCGDFMPGFDDDWVLDERLAFRQKAVQEALNQSALAPGEIALNIIDAALRIDPLNQEVAERKVQILESLGKQQEAMRTASLFRLRVLRDLGAVVNVEPKTPSPVMQNPLVTTGEWLISRNPEEAVSFLAATKSSWLAMDSSIALSFHERVLEASQFESRSRDLVEAQRLYLMWIVGRFRESNAETRRAFREAIQTEELETASILGTALTFGLLSDGQFGQSLRHAKKVRAFATVRNDLTEIVRAERNLAIIEQHAGTKDSWIDRILRTKPLYDQLASAEEIANHNLIFATAYIQLGKLDIAAEYQASAQRFFESNESTRMTGFTLVSKIEILLATGHYKEALEVVEQIRRLGANAIGHSLTAIVDDISGCILAKLNELDLAAESLARAVIYRRRLGSHSSIFELNAVSPTRLLLKEKLREQDIRAAFSRARVSSQPVV